MLPDSTACTRWVVDLGFYAAACRPGQPEGLSASKPRWLCWGAGDGLR
jgi:hypothetical protein